MDINQDNCLSFVYSRDASYNKHSITNNHGSYNNDNGALR